MSLFIMCGQGLETLLADELSELNITDLTPGFCGVYVKTYSMETVYTINYRSRIASRVLLPLIDFTCENKEDLYKNTKKFRWWKYFSGNKTMAIDANVTSDSIRHSLFAAQVVKDAICDQLLDLHQWRPSIDIKNPDIQLNIFIHENRAVLSFDMSGQPLFKRNYRQVTGAAPLQESLAAALLRIAKYSRDDVTIDPCCGSGTLLIEAALIATNTPPGYFRKSFGFMSHPDFNSHAWQAIKRDADRQITELKKGILWGCEHDPEMVRACRTNILAAGFEKSIEIILTDFIKHTPKAAYNLLITNPPHGKRLGDETELKQLYRALGDFMKKKMAKPARAFVFTTSSALAKEVGLAAKRRHILKSSGMESRLLEFDIY